MGFVGLFLKGCEHSQYPTMLNLILFFSSVMPQILLNAKPDVVSIEGESNL